MTDWRKAFEIFIYGLGGVFIVLLFLIITFKMITFYLKGTKQKNSQDNKED